MVIYVTDVDDLAAVFTQHVYKVSVPEDLAPVRCYKHSIRVIDTIQTLATQAVASPGRGLGDEFPPTIFILDLEIFSKSEVKNVAGQSFFKFLTRTKITDLWLLDYQKPA